MDTNFVPMQNDAADPPVTFSGAQGPAKRTECVLIYDPATGTFTLEKLLSTFTLNLTSAGANLHPPLSLPKCNPGQSDDSGASDDGSSDGDATKADKENPFDYRNFINNKFEVPTSSSGLRGDKDRKQRLEKFHEELSDPNASAEDEDVDEDNGGLIIEENPIIAIPAPVRQTLPARPRATPSVAAPKPRAKPNAKTPAANKKSSANGPISLSSTAKKSAIPTEEIDLTLSHPETSHKRPHDEVSSSESDADNESGEDENEFPGSGDLIVEGEDADDGRNNRSRSTTAGLGSSWVGGNRGGPVSLSAAAQGDEEMDSDDDDDEEEEEEEEEMVAPSPMAYNEPISLSGRQINVLDEDEESSDEDEEPYKQQAQVQSAPTPNGNGDGEYEEEEEEEEEEYDLAGMLEEALDEGEEESESEEE